MSDLVFKICSTDEWRQAERAGAFHGTPLDLRDGFIHLSTSEQLAGTLAEHFPGAGDLLLVAVDVDAVGPNLKWEKSRGGALFPHLFTALPLNAVRWVKPLPLGADGRHLLPDLSREGG